MRARLRVQTLPPNLIAVAVLVVAVGGGGIAIGAGSGGSGTVRACFAKKTGAVRVLTKSSQKCTRKETAFTVNAQGKVGPTGPRGGIGPGGAAGANGARGPTGPAGADGADGAAGPTGPPGGAGARGPTGGTGGAGPSGAAGSTGATGATGPGGSEAWHEIAANTTGSCSANDEFCGTSPSCAWTNLGAASWDSAAYYRDPTGVVHLKGLVKFASACLVFQRIFALPPGYRPGTTGSVYPAVSADAPAVIYINDANDGALRYQTAAGSTADPTSWVSLAAISFRCQPAGVNGCP